MPSFYFFIFEVKIMADTNLFKVNMICRNDLAVNWIAKNPILAAGELGLETDTGLIKIGNGVQNWNSIVNYINPQVTDKQFEIQVYASNADLPDAADAKDNVLYIVPTTETYKYYVKQRMLHKEEKTREETVEVPIEETKDDSQTSSSETQETSTETTTTDDTTTDSSTTETTSTDEKTETTDGSTTTEGDTSTTEGSTTEEEKPKTQTITKIVTYYEYYYAYDTISTLDLTDKVKTYEELTETTLYNFQSLAADLSQKVQELQAQAVSQQDQTALTTALEQAKAIDSMYNELTSLVTNTNLARNDAKIAALNADNATEAAYAAESKALIAMDVATSAASTATEAASNAQTQADNWTTYTDSTVPALVEAKITNRITNEVNDTALWSGSYLNDSINFMNEKIENIVPVSASSVKSSLGVYEPITFSDINSNSTYQFYNGKKWLEATSLTEELWDQHIGAYYGFKKKTYLGAKFNLKLNKGYDRILIAYEGVLDKAGTSSTTKANFEFQAYYNSTSIAEMKTSSTLQGYVEFFNEHGYWWARKVNGCGNLIYSGQAETMGIKNLLKYSIDKYPYINNLYLDIAYLIANYKIIGLYGVPSTIQVMY